MYYVGLDVHYRTSTYCILNAYGRELKCETIRGHWPKLLDRLATIKGKWAICFEASELKRDMLLDELADVKRCVRTGTKALDKMGRRHPGVTLLRTIPGVGMRTAETIAAYIDDPKRFGRSSQVAAYFGLIPCQDASAGVNRLGHITRQGPGTARKYLVEAAWQGVYRSPKIRAYFERILRGKKERRKIALVATAHYLLRCMHAMLVRCEPWREAA